MDLDNFISNATRNQLPFDSHCGHGPIVFNIDQCKSSNISNIDIVNSGANIVREAGKKFVPYVSPYIRYFEEESNETLTEEGNNTTAQRKDKEGCQIIPTYEDIMYRRPNTLEIYRGAINDIEVIYPNYNEAPDAFIDNLWAYDQFDGVVLQNNWPLDNLEKQMNETALYLPYFSE
ncbi:jg23845, partial [Pararge aegeria aegeria]